MTNSEQTLLNLFQENIHDLSEPRLDENDLNAIELANIFVNTAAIVSVIDFLEEQLWLHNSKGSTISFDELLNSYFDNEIRAFSFFKGFILDNGPQKFKSISKMAKVIESKVLWGITKSSKKEQKSFAIQALTEMSNHFIFEEEQQNLRDQSLGHKGPRFYRTFDRLDEVLNLDYTLDKNMNIEPNQKERLYEKTGVGVQSGYSTILLALSNLVPGQGSRMIDLGSGYGRVGLVCSLLRPDIDFIGYEYVSHRVEVSNSASREFGLADSLTFITQDLSLESFSIPDADIYYLYDPFSKPTYQYVLKQIVEISKRKKVVVVTKGNAREWLTSIAKEQGWNSAVHIDNGNLCIFNSQ